jgi:lipid-binding SYLF domain-containing protein
LAAALRSALETAAAAETAALRQDALAAEVFGPKSGSDRGGEERANGDEPGADVARSGRGYLATLTGIIGDSLAATFSAPTESRGWQYLTAAVLVVLAALVGANIIRGNAGSNRPPLREQVLTVLQRQAPVSQLAMESALRGIPTQEESAEHQAVTAVTWFSTTDGQDPGDRFRPASSSPASNELTRGSQPSIEDEQEGPRSDSNRSGAAAPGESSAAGGQQGGDSSTGGEDRPPTSERSEDPAEDPGSDRTGGGISAEWTVIPAGSIPNDLGRRSYSAAAAFRTIMNSLEDGLPDALLDETTCVAALPGVVKVGFVIGGRSGKGLMSCRTRGGWSRPAFVSISGGSIGLQIGAQATDFVLLFASTLAVDRLAHGALELGSDGASVATGPVDQSAEVVSRGDARPEVYSYSLSRGLFAGISLEGSTLVLDRSANTEVYGTDQPGAGLLSSHGGELQRELASFLDELAHHSR